MRGGAERDGYLGAICEELQAEEGVGEDEDEANELKAEVREERGVRLR